MEEKTAQKAMNDTRAPLEVVYIAASSKSRAWAEVAGPGNQVRLVPRWRYKKREWIPQPCHLQIAGAWHKCPVPAACGALRAVLAA